MKIKQGSTAYNQIKECFQVGQKHTKQTLAAYEADGLSLVRYVWDMLWAGMIINDRVRLHYQGRGSAAKENDIILPLGTNDNHIETALKHILSQD